MLLILSYQFSISRISIYQLALVYVRIFLPHSSNTDYFSSYISLLFPFPSIPILLPSFNILLYTILLLFRAVNFLYYFSFLLYLSFCTFNVLLLFRPFTLPPPVHNLFFRFPSLYHSHYCSAICATLHLCVFKTLPFSQPYFLHCCYTE